jgi:hypothetical protein
MFTINLNTTDLKKYIEVYKMTEKMENKNVDDLIEITDKMDSILAYIDSATKKNVVLRCTIDDVDVGLSLPDFLSEKIINKIGVIK